MCKNNCMYDEAVGTNCLSESHYDNSSLFSFKGQLNTIHFIVH